MKWHFFRKSDGVHFACAQKEEAIEARWLECLNEPGTRKADFVMIATDAAQPDGTSPQLRDGAVVYELSPDRVERGRLAESARSKFISQGFTEGEASLITRTNTPDKMVQNVRL